MEVGAAGAANSMPDASKLRKIMSSMHLVILIVCVVGGVKRWSGERSPPEKVDHNDADADDDDTSSMTLDIVRY
jgi:hypothetical protein